jgi:N-acetylglucosaminyldiphosphoundecaprenol N-acetyl-beta-D-mannosaminyltransferase
VDRKTASVLGIGIDVLNWDAALGRLLLWGRLEESRYVCICNVHSVVTAGQDPGFERVVHEADLATPDGAPVAWLMRRMGVTGQDRINGPDLMWRYCELSNKLTYDLPSIFMYGGSEEVLSTLQKRLTAHFPNLQIAGAYSPPFRPLSSEEDEEVVKLINQSGAGVVWVSLGCPKQEFWMAAHRGRIQAVMVGVGAAFDYHAGTIKRAPLWMQRSGLEWFHRLLSEPRRLWRRYLITNTLFIFGAAKQFISGVFRR